MSRLVLQKEYLREAFSKKIFSRNVSYNAACLMSKSPKTTFNTFWYLYLSSFVNDISDTSSHKSSDSLGVNEVYFKGDTAASLEFIDLTLTYSTVGFLPEQINSFFVKKHWGLEFVKQIFASYMVLLGSNYISYPFQIHGVDVDTKKDAISSFDKLLTLIKALDPSNTMLKLYDICMNAISVNTDNMLSFNVSEIIEYFKEYYEVDLSRCNFKDIEFLTRIDGTDILSILMNTDKLYPEDLEFFTAELETSGNYDSFYIKRCKDRISALMCSKADIPEKTYKHKKGSVFVGIDNLVPSSSLLDENVIDLKRDAFMNNVIKLRTSRHTDWKKEFNSVVSQFSDLSSDFIKENATFFTPEEFDLLLVKYDMGEDFLEQYFSSIDPAVISGHQHFSEAFFMKHFTELNYNIVLKKGVNEWRLKENRSKKLDVFLRLKGVNI